MGEAIGQALQMPKAEQRARMRLMREMVRTRNVYRWAAEMLLDASRLRHKACIVRMVSSSGGRPEAA
jgi:trehalose 6-phosphate synthase